MKNNRTQKQKQKRKRKVKIMKWYRTDYRRIINKLRRKDFGKKKAKKPKKVLPPYRVVILQGKVERLEGEIRALALKDPKREKLVKKLQEIKIKLGK